jgi:predicted acylesterase/phospholipase RssA
MTYKHLVLSGGGHIMLQVLGSIKYLEEHKYIELNKIESIYGTSAGAMIGVFLALKIDLDIINDYIINRPWQDVFNVKIEQIFDIYSKKGLFDTKIVEKCFKPLFDSKDISINITLDEFYQYSGIEIHFFTFDVNEFKLENISYLTHPSLSLITAIHMTCAIPVLVTPVFVENKCYIDGGIVCNYPLKYCIDSGINEDEILGFKNEYYDNDTSIKVESTLLNYITNFLFKIMYRLNTENNDLTPHNELICSTEIMTFQILYSSLSNIEIRQRLFLAGKEDAIKFIENVVNKK